MSKIVLVHEEDGYTLKNAGVVLQGVTEVKRVMEDGIPYVEVSAELNRKEYVTEKPSAMVLVVGPEGESLRHGDQFIEGLVSVEEKDGVVKMKLEVASEDYAPLRAAKKEKKAEPKVAPKPVVAPKKVEEKPEA
jgi:hypothetical protein